MTCWSVQAHIRYFGILGRGGGSSAKVIFTKNRFKIDLHSDSHESISFKLGMIIDTTKVYIWYQCDLA